MANETSFDLNLAIQRWRENLAQSPAFQSENLNELESHLRDSVASLQTGRLSDEEAFLIASRRVGVDKQLETEFGKVNGYSVWLDRISWMLVGWLVWNVVSSFIGAVTSAGLAFGWKMTNYDIRVNGEALPAILSGLVQLMGLVGGLAFCWWLLTRKARKMGNWLQRFLSGPFTLAISCVVLWAVIFLPHAVSMAIMRYYGLVAAVQILTPANTSQAITSLIQVPAMVIVTLLFARKRLRSARA